MLVLYRRECGEEQKWDLLEMDGWPPIDFDCKDLTGGSCQYIAPALSSGYPSRPGSQEWQAKEESHEQGHQ